MIMNWWGVMFFIIPLLTGVTIGTVIIACEIFKFLGRLSK